MAYAGWTAVIQDDRGNIQPGATVEVRNINTGSLAVLYADRLGTVGLGNPFQADSEGYATFFAKGAEYRITATRGAWTTEWPYVPVGTTQGVDLSDLALGLDYDAQVNTLPERDAYDGEPEGFSVLVSDVGDGRGAVYTRTDVPGEWSDPAFITGVPGPATNISIGTVDTVDYGEGSSATMTGASPAQVLNLELERGAPGRIENFQGPWSGSVTYASGDIVESGGSAYMAMVADPAGPPPGADWELVVQGGGPSSGSVYYSSLSESVKRNVFLTPDVVGITGSGNEASEFYGLCSMAETLGVPINLAGYEFSVNSDESDSAIHFDQDNVTIYGPGKIKGDIFKIRGNGWRIRDHVEFEFAGEDDIAARYATTGALGGMFLSGSDNRIDSSCKVYRTVAPSATFWAGRGTLVVMGMDYEIGDTGDAISAITGPAPTGHDNWIEGCELYNSSTGVRANGKRNWLLKSYIHDCAVPSRWEGTSRSCTIRGNRLFGMGTNGPGGAGHAGGLQDGTDCILVSRPALDMLIEDNELAFAAEHGLYFQGSRSVVRNNKCHDCSNSSYKFAAYDTALYWYDDEDPLLLYPGGLGYVSFDVQVIGNEAWNGCLVSSTDADYYFQVGSTGQHTGLIDYRIEGNVSRDCGGRGYYTAYADTTDGWLAGFSFRDNECWGAAGVAMWLAGDEGMTVDGFKTDGEFLFFSPKGNANTGFARLAGIKADLITLSNGTGILENSEVSDLVLSPGLPSAGWDLDDVRIENGGNLDPKKIRQIRDCKGTVLSMIASSTNGFIESLIGNDITFTISGGYAMDGSSSTTAFGTAPKFSGNVWRAPNTNNILRLGTGQTGANISGDTFIPATGATTTDPCIQVSGDGNVLTGVITSRGNIFLPSGADNNIVIGCRTAGAIVNSGSGNQVANNVVV